MNSSYAFYKQMARACLLIERVLVIRVLPACQKWQQPHHSQISAIARPKRSDLLE